MKLISVLKSAIHRVLKRQQYYQFHIQRIQAVLPTDYTLCSAGECSGDVEEMRASTTRFFNSWSTENSHEIRNSRFQHQFGINLWDGIYNMWNSDTII